MHHHFGVKLHGVVDVQLIHNATLRKDLRWRLWSLDAVITTSELLSDSERHTWTQTKHNGTKLYQPHKGGSYEVFNQRPMSQEIIDYCVNYVKLLI
ncbi:hypothetical protein QBC38DRAFT_456739 [Podospora fimiseda]|uniref:Uncharacterized protein n=1 Tax=Podospora fimiseda TaxID=252190 RepID=A0AAN7BMZ8_9PEZI|nr:hypothetical protein QBC38DRAFT_456739 [Podospora fimiseda]